MSHHCPECQRVIYSRRLKFCGYCNAPIPESLQFTTEEVAALDHEIEKSNQQFSERERAAAEEEEDAKRRERGDDGIDLSAFF